MCPTAQGRLGEKEKGRLPKIRLKKPMADCPQPAEKKVGVRETKQKKEICVRLPDVRPTAGCLAGCKEPDCCVGVRPPSRLKKKKKKTK